MIIEPQIGDIWTFPVFEERSVMVNRHLIVLEFFDTVEYDGETRAARCQLCETGQKYEVYVDHLMSEGVKLDGIKRD